MKSQSTNMPKVYPAQPFYADDSSKRAQSALIQDYDNPVGKWHEYLLWYILCFFLPWGIFVWVLSLFLAVTYRARAGAHGGCGFHLLCVGLYIMTLSGVSDKTHPYYAHDKHKHFVHTHSAFNFVVGLCLVGLGMVLVRYAWLLLAQAREKMKCTTLLPLSSVWETTEIDTNASKELD